MTERPHPLIGIIMGSDSDLPVMSGAIQVLEDFGLPYEVQILSAHRCPDETANYARESAEKGLKVLIAGAGWAAHLAGALAAQSTLPVIGIPIDSSPLQGLDALLSTAQMPPGVPVATMSIGKGGAQNAALFAVQILALLDPNLARKLEYHKQDMKRDVLLHKNNKLQEHLSERKTS